MGIKKIKFETPSRVEQETILMKSARKSPYFNAGMDRAYRL